MAKHGGEELVICEDNGVDEDIVAEFYNKKLVVCRTYIQHVAVLVLHEDRRGALGLLVRLQHRRCAVKRSKIEALLARLACIFAQRPGTWCDLAFLVRGF